MPVTERRFECTLCGACCRRPGIVVIDADELVTIAGYRDQTAGELAAELRLEQRPTGWWMRLRGEPCPFLVDERCSIQSVKPRQCATYPFWPEIVGDNLAWEAERAHCPGIGEGRTWSALEIQSKIELLGE